jgi:hypothetical protein
MKVYCETKLEVVSEVRGEVTLCANLLSKRRNGLMNGYALVPNSV